MAMTAAQLLDELMGRDRNLVPGEKSTQVHWSHTDTCKNFLCGFCPHDLFVNTKADLGPCAKIHDDTLKTEYEKSSRHGHMGFEDEFFHFLSNIQADVDRKIHRGHERLMMNKQREQEMSQNDSDKTKMLTDHINQLLEEIEQLGSEGKVEEAQGVAKLVDQLKEEKEQSKLNPGATANQEKQMEVCEVCGAFLIVGDAQSRVDDHLQGKQHVGYARIKSTIEDLKARPWLKRKETAEVPSKEIPVKTEESRSRDRKTERPRDSRSSRDRSRDRDRRHRSRSRDKSRSDRRRSRERSEKDKRSHRSRDSRDSRRSSHKSRSKSPRSSSHRSHRRSRSRSRERSSRRSRNSSRDRKDERSPKRHQREGSDSLKERSSETVDTKKDTVTSNGDTDLTQDQQLNADENPIKSEGVVMKEENMDDEGSDDMSNGVPN